MILIYMHTYRVFDKFFVLEILSYWVFNYVNSLFCFAILIEITFPEEEGGGGN